MQLGKLGVWAPMDAMTAAEGAAFAQRVEGWGYSALWLPESRGRNVLAHSAWLLANTERLIIAPGIANIYARDPMAMANGQRGLNEQSAGRFLLGLGVSHRPSVEGLRGHNYGKPVATMRSYLEAMKAAPYAAPAHPGALGRRRRSRLHPIDQPGRLAPAGREGAGAAGPGAGLTRPAARPTFASGQRVPQPSPKSFYRCIPKPRARSPSRSSRSISKSIRRRPTTVTSGPITCASRTAATRQCNCATAT